MSDIKETAAQFFDACETGKGWEACSAYCHPGATFSAQADVFAELSTIEEYAGAMAGLIAGPLPDASYDMKALAVDEEHGSVTAYAVFKGTQSGEGGPVPPTGKRVESDYVFVIDFDDGRVKHVTKIWNEGWAMRQMGWA